MKRKIFFVMPIIIGMIFGSFAVASASHNPEKRKIVVFRAHITESVKEKVVREHGTSVKNLHIINGKVALLTENEAREVANDPNVLRVDEDIIVEAIDIRASAKSRPSPSPTPSQTISWGITRVNAPLAWTNTTAVGIKVAVIDTGIDLSHPDLKANIKGGFNTISSRQSYTDDNGHGTHVAGIIGALNNTIGSVGVAPSVSLYSVKALNRNGSGYLSDIIEGIDWAIANKIQVINMSLGASTGNQSFADAIARAHTAGLVIVAAAGNNGGAVLYPAAYPDVIAVSATDSVDATAYFTNHGPEVDFSAPGVGIYSTYKNSSYATLSGTSMASPFVAGTVALVLSRPITSPYDLNTDTLWQPEEVLKKLQDTATDLGPTGFDEYFGSGLINANLAVQ